MLHKLMGCGLFLAGFIAISGCGSGHAETGGVLTWEDGAPIAGASLNFLPADGKGAIPGGTTDKAGEFKLTTGNKPGAPPGDYTVTVTKITAGGAVNTGETKGDPADIMKAMAKMAGGDKKAAAPKNELPAVYADAKTSPLKATVRAGQKIELKLKKS